MSDPPGDLDRRFLAAATRLGRSGLGTTWPNPSVGAILVKCGRVVGRGATAPGGRPHAETVAIAKAGEAARGATLYVSLEPCSHHGRTPPCAEAVAAAGIARVVAGPADPDERVAGRGYSTLRDGGIEVVPDLLPDHGRRAHAGHFSRVRRGRPHVCLKLAVSADDAIGAAGRGQVAITGETARRHVHALRSRSDAILAGRGTVQADDPQLDVRLPGLEHRSPVRVIVDTEGALGPGYRAFRSGAPGATWVLQASPPPKGPDSDPVRRFQVAPGPAGINLVDALARLAAEGIGRLFVEGGAQIARSLLESDLVDEVVLFRSDGQLGAGAVPALAGLPMSTIERSERFRVIERRRFGPDRMTRYERAT